ncbi:MAG: hypothetical protein AB7R69_00805 [Candidatus Babeliales bacterium]
MNIYDNARDLFLGLVCALLIPLTVIYGLEFLGIYQDYMYFYYSLAAGILFIILGAFLKLGFIGSGFILGGVLTIVLSMGPRSAMSGVKIASLLGVFLLIIGLTVFLKRKS